MYKNKVPKKNNVMEKRNTIRDFRGQKNSEKKNRRI